MGIARRAMPPIRVPENGFNDVFLFWILSFFILLYVSFFFFFYGKWTLVLDGWTAV